MLKNKVCNTILIALAVALVCLASYAIVTMATVSDTNYPQPAAEQYSVPNTGLSLPLVQLEGQWTWSNDGTSFIAQVSGKNISVNLVGTDGTSMNYWAGTFEPAEAAGRTITSQVDESKFVLSQDKTKVFTVGDLSLSFQFSAMGITKTIWLTHA